MIKPADQDVHEDPDLRERPAEGRASGLVRRRIIAAAALCFERFGASKTTMRDIAEEAGLTRRSIYNHFENQAAILHALMMADVERLNQDVGRAIHHLESVEDTLTEGVAKAAEFTFATPYMRNSMSDVRVTALALAPDSQIHRMLRSRWAHFFESARQRGELSEDIDLDRMVSWLNYGHAAIRLVLLSDSVDRYQFRSFVRRFVVEPVVRPQASFSDDDAAVAAPLHAQMDPPDEIQTRILDAASECFARDDETRVTLAGIAAQAGLSRPTLYRRFEARDELHQHMLDHKIDVAFRGLLHAAQGSTDSFSQLAVDWLVRIAQLAQADEQLYLAVVELDPRTNPPTLRKASEAHWRQLMVARDPPLARFLTQDEAVAWLVQAQRILLIRAHALPVDLQDLRRFARRFLIEPLLPRAARESRPSG